MGGRVAEGLKERRSISEREKESEGASGTGPPGGSRLLLLLSLSNFPIIPSPHLSKFICFSLYFPCQISFSLSLPYFSPTFPLLHCLSPSFPLYSGPQSEDRLLAGRCWRGGRASESLMRCLSPQSRLDCSSQQRITTTITIAHCTALNSVPCLPATAAAEGVARGKVCLGEERREWVWRVYVWEVCRSNIWRHCRGHVCVCVSKGYTGRAAFLWGMSVYLPCVYTVYRHFWVTVCATVSAISIIRVCEKLALGQTILWWMPSHTPPSTVIAC